MERIVSVVPIPIETHFLSGSNRDIFVFVVHFFACYNLYFISINLICIIISFLKIYYRDKLISGFYLLHYLLLKTKKLNHQFFNLFWLSLGL